MKAVRAFHPRDAARIREFPQSEEELFFFFPRASWPLTENQIIASAESRLFPMVAVEDGMVAGFGNIISVKNGTAEIGNLVVAAAHRRKGAARALIAGLTHAAARHLNAETMRASCFNENTRGLLLYHHLGFSPAAMEPRTRTDGKRVMLIHLEVPVSSFLDMAEKLPAESGPEIIP